MDTSIQSMPTLAKLALVAAVSSWIAGCNPANSEVTNPVVKPVKLLEVPDLDKKRFDSFIANIDATDRAELSFQVAGEIDTLAVRMGSEVKKGQVLAELDDTDYQLAYDAKLAQYQLAKTAYLRAKQLHEKKLISVDTFDQSETEFKAASAALEQAKTDLEYTKIVAPFDGVVSLTFSKENQVVAANQVVLNVINNDVLDVVFTIPVSYAERYGLSHIGSSDFALVMDSHRDVMIPAQFKEISTEPDSDTNSYRASLTFTRPETLNLLPGMTGQVKLHNAQLQGQFAIDDSAWVSRDQHHGELYRFDDQTQTLEIVQVMVDAQGHITSGLNQGDLIVQAGVERLMPGQQVKAWTKEGGI
ncbi:efflux RND transporter periplasmic adaptor subunit [Vibrio cholerae]